MFRSPPRPSSSSSLHRALGALASHRAAANVDVPVEILAVVDDGGSPDAFTSAAFRRGNRANQLAKGKADALAALRDALLKEARAAFPEASKEFERVTKS